MHEKYRHLRVDTGNLQKQEIFTIRQCTSLTPKTAPLAVIYKQSYKFEDKVVPTQIINQVKERKNPSQAAKKSIYTFGLTDFKNDSGMVYFSDLSDTQVQALLELLEQESPLPYAKKLEPKPDHQVVLHPKTQWLQFQAVSKMIEEMPLNVPTLNNHPKRLLLAK